MATFINDYKLIKKIGIGAYGQVWKARHITTQKEVAIKLEKKNTRNMLKYETIILRHLSNVQNVVNIKYYGEINNYNYLIMELLNQPVHIFYNKDMRENDSENITIKRFGLQMLQCIKSIHNMGIIHRDIKPSNFLLNTTNKSLLLIDFGLAKQYISRGGIHKPNVCSIKICGTLRYISTYVHDRNEPSRRDDIISMVYVIIFLMKRILPWQDVIYSTRIEKYQMIHNIKKMVTHEELCNLLPDKLKNIIDYSYGLKYSETPDYDYIEFLLKTI